MNDDSGKGKKVDPTTTVELVLAATAAITGFMGEVLESTVLVHLALFIGAITLGVSLIAWIGKD